MAIALAFVLITLQRDLVIAIAGTAIFLILSGIGINPFETPYFKEVLAEGSFVFPNTFETITEMWRFSLPQVLEQPGWLDRNGPCLSRWAGVICDPAPRNRARICPTCWFWPP